MSCECEELLWVAACLVHVGVSARWLSDQSTQGKGKGLWAKKPWPQTRLLPQHLCLWYSNKAAHISLTWLIRSHFSSFFSWGFFRGPGRSGAVLRQLTSSPSHSLNGEGHMGHCSATVGVFLSFFFLTWNPAFHVYLCITILIQTSTVSATDRKHSVSIAEPMSLLNECIYSGLSSGSPACRRLPTVLPTKLHVISFLCHSHSVLFVWKSQAFYTQIISYSLFSVYGLSLQHRGNCK